MSLAFPIPELRKPATIIDPHRRGRKPASPDTVVRGELKQAEKALRAARMRSLEAKWHPSLRERLEIVRGLLQLQRRGLLRVWVDGDVIRLGLCETTVETPTRKAIAWATAMEIVDNPEKNLCKVLRILESGY